MVISTKTNLFFAFSSFVFGCPQHQDSYFPFFRKNHPLLFTKFTLLHIM